MRQTTKSTGSAKKITTRLEHHPEAVRRGEKGEVVEMEQPESNFIRAGTSAPTSSRSPSSTRALQAYRAARRDCRCVFGATIGR